MVYLYSKMHFLLIHVSLSVIKVFGGCFFLLIIEKVYDLTFDILGKSVLFSCFYPRKSVSLQRKYLNYRTSHLTKFKSYIPGEPLFTTAEILKEYRT